MLLRHRRLVLGVLVTSQLLTGCTSWQVVSVSPRALVDSAHTSAIRVRGKEGATYVLDAPRMEGDSLVGIVTRAVQAYRTTERPPTMGPVVHVERVLPLTAIACYPHRVSRANVV